MSYGKIVRQIGIITTIPMILAAGPLVGYWIGLWLDHHFTADPWGKTILTLLGFAAGIKQVITIIRNLDQTQREKQN